MPQRIALFIALLAGVGVTLFMRWVDPQWAADLTREDSLVENLSAGFYALGLIACIAVSVTSNSRLLPVLWAILCLLFLGEETSWFQRLLGYSVPGVEQINAQGEFSLHNLEILQGGKLSDQETSLPAKLLKSQNLFRIGFFGYFLLLPLLSFWGKAQPFLQRLKYQRPSIWFHLALLGVFGLSFSITLMTDSLARAPIAESREMLYSMFIALYCLFYLTPRESNTAL